MDSNVLRPITTGLPLVVRLNYLRSSGIYQIKSLSLPITLLDDTAAIKEHMLMITPQMGI
jgi:hypothetical protein